VIQSDGERLNELKSQISAAYGREPLDLLVKNVRLVNVYSGNVVLTNIGIKAGRVVTISPERPPVRPIAIFEGDDMYAIPGLNRRPLPYLIDPPHPCGALRGDRPPGDDDPVDRSDGDRQRCGL